MSLIPSLPSETGTSTRPYLIRALHEWCSDNGYTPYVAVFVDAGVRVPMEYVKNNEIVLNVGFEATTGMKLGNEFIEFQARFGGVSREIAVPVSHVIAIYARENGQGMAFPAPTGVSTAAVQEVDAQASHSDKPATVPGGLRLASTDGHAPAATLVDDGQPPEPPSGGRPSLKRIK